MNENNIDENALKDAFAEDAPTPQQQAVLFAEKLVGTVEDVKSAKHIKILLHNQDGETGDQAVFVAAQGIGYSIPREKIVSVPEPILAALEDAVETKYYREEKDGQSFGPVLERTVRRFPFSVK